MIINVTHEGDPTRLNTDLIDSVEVSRHTDGTILALYINTVDLNEDYQSITLEDDQLASMDADLVDAILTACNLDRVLA